MVCGFGGSMSTYPFMYVPGTRYDTTLEAIKVFRKSHPFTRPGIKLLPLLCILVRGMRSSYIECD